MYVLMPKEGDRFVAGPAGLAGRYTRFLQLAEVFRTAEEADASALAGERTAGVASVFAENGGLR